MTNSKPHKRRNEQQQMIIVYLRNYGTTDACDSIFHECFYLLFGGKRKETNYGASPVYKAQRLLATMVNDDILTRNCQSLADLPSGFPKWVWVYQLKDATPWPTVANTAERAPISAKRRTRKLKH